MKSWMKSAIDSVAMFGYLGYHNDVNIYPNDANNEIISVACVEASSHSAGCHTPLWRQQHGCHWRGEELGIAVTCEPGPIITQHIASQASHQRQLPRLPSPVSCFRMRRVKAGEWCSCVMLFLSPMNAGEISISVGDDHVATGVMIMRDEGDAAGDPRKWAASVAFQVPHAISCYSELM